MSIKIVLAMESNNEPETTDEVVGVEVANAATEVEAATTELGETEGEVEDYSDGIDTSVDAVGELEEVHDQLEESVKSGEGVSEETAKMAEIAVEAICAKVGISARQARVVPAMESFGSANSRLTATKLAMEGIKEQAVRIWKAVKEAAIYVWNMVKKFFVNMTDSRKKMENYIGKLKTNVSKATGEAKQKTLKVGAKSFSIRGQANPETVMKIVKMSGELGYVAEEAASQIADYTKSSLDGVPGKGAAKDMFSKLGESTGDTSGSYTRPTTKAYGNFVNGRAIIVADAEGEAGLPKLAIDVVEKTFAKEIEAPNKAQLTQILDLASVTLKALTEFDKTSKIIEKINKDCVAFTDKMIKNNNSLASADGVETDKKGDKKAAEEVKKINNMVAKIGTAIPSLMYGAVKAAADYANAGLKNMGAGEAKPEPAAETK